jgi:hypothetical protein
LGDACLCKDKRKRNKRLSPYSPTEIWDRDELLTIIKYERKRRNKAALALFWDLDARNHEVTMLQIKNLRLKEKEKAKFHMKPRLAQALFY